MGWYSWRRICSCSCWEQIRLYHSPLCFGHNSQKGLPGQFPRCFWVTFNANSKVTRAPAINKPRIKPVNCPAGGRRGPAGVRQGHGDTFWRKALRVPARTPYGTREGVCGVLTRLVGDPVAVPPVPLWSPNGFRSGPLHNLQGDR